MQLPSTPASALSARGFITATLRGWGLDALIEVVALLAGELVTNAVVHTRSAVSLVVGRADHAVRVEVHDASPGRPELGMAAGDDEGGRGLALVDALATRWGVDADGAGKSVWFEVATSQLFYSRILRP
jgi:anti-sigma regulatory factor (Ser/Thr protein kinase)